MAHFKRKKSKRSVCCTLCTPYRWRGNSKDRKKAKERSLCKEQDKEIKTKE